MDGCGVSEFQRQSILRREELFRQEINDHPRIYAEQVRLEALAGAAKSGSQNLETLVPPSPRERLVPIGQRAKA